MVDRGKPKRHRFHIGYVLAAVVIVVVVYFGSLALFPDWNQSTSVLVALAVVVIAGVVTFLSDFRTAFAPTADNTPPPIQQSTNISGGVNIDSQRTDIKGNVVGRDNIEHASGDIVHGDKIVQQAAAPAVNALHQLPPPSADFTGRTADLDAILNDIAQGTVISGVRGMGGIGKTALALVIADRLKAQYPDAQFFIPLRGSSDAPMKPVEAMLSVIRAYHPVTQLPDDATQIAALYRSVLDGQRAIVLLDDAKDAAQITPLLPPKSCLVLITTRNTFAVPGLHARDLLIAIAPSLEGIILSAEGAKNLFANQLEILRRLTTAQNDTMTVVDVIAHFCGYLPLALRAAASLIAATPDLNPLIYATQLRDERTRLTKIGKEGVDIDVEASLNLSYQQLSPEAARVFRQLSVFPATFDTAAEEAVCEDADHIYLSQLVRLSLVEFDPHPNPLPTPARFAASSALRGERESGRYSLHDLTRLFAAALPSPVDAPLVDGGRAGDGGSGDLPAAQLRHATHYKDVLATCDNLYLQGNDTILQGLALFDREWPNIQIGQTWAAMHVGGDNAAAQLCSDYPDVGAQILSLRHHPRAEIQWREQALAAARSLEDRSGESVHLGNLGYAYDDLGEYHKAVKFYDQDLAIAQEIRDRHNEGTVLNLLGVSYINLGEIRKAIEYCEQALLIAREIGDRRGEGNALGNFGIAYKNLGETRRAIEFYEQQLVIAREISDRRGEGTALGNLGNAYSDLGERQNAIKYYNEALAIAREIGDRQGEGTCLWNMADEFDKLNDRAQAIAHAEASLKIKEAIEDPRVEKVRQQLAKWKGSPSTDS